jgi:hypothetical protein
MKGSLRSVLDKAVREAVEVIEGECERRSLAPASQTADFKPIEGLKPGDRVVYGGMGTWTVPEKGVVGTVCRVLDPPVESVESGSPIKRLDFTMLIVNSSTMLEYGFDSRYFKRGTFEEYSGS